MFNTQKRSVLENIDKTGLIFSNKFTELLTFVNKRIKKLKREKLVKSTRMIDSSENISLEISNIIDQKRESRDINRILKDSYDKSKVKLLVENLKQKEQKYKSMKNLNSTPTKCSQTSLNCNKKSQGIFGARKSKITINPFITPRINNINSNISFESSTSCVKHEELQTKSIINSNRPLCTSKIERNINLRDRGFCVSAKDQLFTDKKQSLLGSDKNNGLAKTSINESKSQLSEINQEYPFSGCGGNKKVCGFRSRVTNNGNKVTLCMLRRYNMNISAQI